ncbi:hypothetical protein GCM10023353_15270 [Tomitella cavernea]|uniref:Uncharacterized protein n=1 Tax=Tomitella cavernea TaxID=1387982 RepID=A0ABP9CLR0_9ACTN
MAGGTEYTHTPRVRFRWRPRSIGTRSREYHMYPLHGPIPTGSPATGPPPVTRVYLDSPAAASASPIVVRTV